VLRDRNRDAELAGGRQLLQHGGFGHRRLFSLEGAYA